MKSEILDQAPPNDKNAETWVVGSILLRPTALDAIGFLTPADFYDENLRTIFQELYDMHRRGEPIDIGLIKRQFPGDEWAARFAEIIIAVPVASHALHYAGIVSKLSKLRHLREMGIELMQAAHNPNGIPEEIIERVETDLLSLQPTDGDGGPVTLADAAVQASLRIDEIAQRGQGFGIPTGLHAFDADFGGLFPGELTILAARTGCGKTSFALQIAAHNAEHGRLVYFASLEMSATELSTRLACAESGVSNRLVRNGHFRDGDTARLALAFNQQPAHLEIDDRAALTVAMIRREIRKRKKRGIVLAVIDYMGLITPHDRKLTREQQVAHIVRSFKEMAREYEIPILVLCQLNREADGEEIPRLSQLRESGAIEQDADVVLFLSRHNPTLDEQHNAILTVAKNRNGEVGPLKLHWDAGRTRFYDANYSPEFSGFEQ